MLFTTSVNPEKSGVLLSRSLTRPDGCRVFGPGGTGRNRDCLLLHTVLPLTAHCFD
jgi:hypothetical protein